MKFDGACRLDDRLQPTVSCRVIEECRFDLGAKAARGFRKTRANLVGRGGPELVSGHAFHHDKLSFGQAQPDLAHAHRI